MDFVVTFGDKIASKLAVLDDAVDCVGYCRRILGGNKKSVLAVVYRGRDAAYGAGDCRKPLSISNYGSSIFNVNVTFIFSSNVN